MIDLSDYKREADPRFEPNPNRNPNLDDDKMSMDKEALRNAFKLAGFIALGSIIYVGWPSDEPRGYATKPMGTSTIATTTSNASSPDVMARLQAYQSRPKEVTYPPEQRDFMNGLNERAPRYASGLNEIQKSAVYRETLEWVEAQAKSQGDTMTSWKGKIIRMTTDKGGDMVGVKFSVKLSSTEVEFSQTGGNLLGLYPVIRRGSTVYDQLSNMAVGDLVCFSGKFLRDPVYGKIVENSMTERGRMDNPSFGVALTSVTRCDP